MKKSDKIIVFFKWFRTAWATRWWEKRDKTRTELRQQTTTVEGKTMRVLDYIDLVAPKLVRVTMADGSPVNHREKLRQIYYDYDLKGLNLYIKRLVRRNKREVKRLSKKINLK